MPGDIQTIYDFGMNMGHDSAYYLKKGFRVVGVDANPEMCRICEDRFSGEIRTGMMTVVNAGVSDEAGRLDFWVNPKHEISTFLPERFSAKEWAPDAWTAVEVEVVRASDLIAEHGEPYYIKIDVEFYDGKILKNLLHNGIRPEYISSEAQEVEICCLLIALGYTKFSLVEGASVHQRYASCEIQVVGGSTVPHSFPPEASGPFGPDLPGPWCGGEEMLRRVLSTGLGWIDIHATL